MFRPVTLNALDGQTMSFVTRYVAPALRIQLRILIAKGITDTQMRMDIIEKAIEAHHLDSSNDFPRRTVRKQAFELAKANKTIVTIHSHHHLKFFVIRTDNPRENA